MDSFNSILFSKNEHVATIILNRPQIRNAFNTAMRDELWEALEAVRDDTEIRCVILSGAGSDFCAGADMTEFGTSPSVVIARTVRRERDIWSLFLDMPKPLIAAIHGHCIGSGLEMVVLCDIRISSDDAKFSMPETHIGLIPAAGGTQTLSRAIGMGPALELLLTGRTVGAKAALEIGLLTKVVSRSILINEALNTAARLAALAPEAVAVLKVALRQGADLPLDGALDMENSSILKLLSHSRLKAI